VTKAYTLLLDDVMPEVRGCDVATALHIIKRTCRDFMDKAVCSRTLLPAMNTLNGVGTYAVVHNDAANFEVGQILLAEYNGKKIFPRTAEWLDDTQGVWERNTGSSPFYSWRTQTGFVRFYTQQSQASITLVAVPDCDTIGGLLLTVADSPIYTGGGIPDDVFNDWNEDIAAGALARLKRMSGKPWSDPAGAQDRQRQYQAAIGSANASASRAYGRAPLRSKAWG
jgi:hypothetical protein